MASVRPPLGQPPARRPWPLGAGEHVQDLRPGNAELIDILEPFEQIV